MGIPRLQFLDHEEHHFKGTDWSVLRCTSSVQRAPTLPGNFSESYFGILGASVCFIEIQEKCE